MKNKYVICILLASILLLGCMESLEEPHVKTLKPVRIAAYNGDAGALVYVAKDLGFFEKNGLDVAVSDFASGRLAMESMLEGSADLATSANSVFVAESFNEPELRAIATISLFDLNNIVLRVDNGIEGITDISGRKVGLSKKSSSEFFFQRYLLLNNIGHENITFVDMNPDDIKKNIINGSLDVGVTWDPNCYEIKKVLGPKVEVIPIQGSQKIYFLLSTKQKWLDENPVIQKQIIKSLLEARDWINDDNERAKKYFMEKFNYEQEYLDYSWSKCQYSVTLKQSLLIALDNQAEWMIREGLINSTKIPNYLNYINTSPLHELEPKAITIIS